MRKEYDFSKARRNPYAKRLKKSVTIRLDAAALKYFKDLAAETGIVEIMAVDAADFSRYRLPDGRAFVLL